jgi:signal transduction histidine kinase
MSDNPSMTMERDQHENALRRLEKLAAVGQEASTIAHEINNPLESLTNLLYLMKLSDSMDEVKGYVAIAQQELARVTEITVQTLRFHRQATKPTEVDLQELANGVMALYSGRMMVRHIEMVWRAREVPRVTCLEGEIRQVLNNLVRNALDAMTSKGRLTIRVSACVESSGERKGVRITVADTGEGIHPEMTGRLFELFQTTKEKTGTGLGLWVSRGIVEKHGGRIRVRSRTGEQSGTVFAVWLPVEGSEQLAA